MRRIQSLVAMTAAVVAGCAHNQAAAPAAMVEHVTAAPPARAEQKTAQATEDLDQVLRGEVLHFDFDQANLTPESRERLQKIAEILRQHPQLAIRVEGNCDERGGEEFNLQLGQERAAAARTYLMNLGIEAERVNTLSYGKDRPVDDSHTSQAWAANRRDDIHVGTR